MSAQASDRRVFSLLLGVTLLGGVAACSSSDGPTCGELADQDAGDRLTSVISLVRANGLDPFSNAIGLAAIEADVMEFCGIDAVIAVTGGEVSATSNIDSPISAGVDWSEYSG